MSELLMEMKPLTNLINHNEQIITISGFFSINGSDING